MSSRTKRVVLASVVWEKTEGGEWEYRDGNTYRRADSDIAELCDALWTLRDVLWRVHDECLAVSLRYARFFNIDESPMGHDEVEQYGQAVMARQLLDLLHPLNRTA